MRTIYVHFAVAAVTFGWLHPRSQSQSQSEPESRGTEMAVLIVSLVCQIYVARSIGNICLGDRNTQMASYRVGELGGRVSNYNSIYETTSDHRDGPLNTFLASCRTTRLAHKLSKLIHSGTNGDTYSLSPLHLDHLHLFSAGAPRIAKNTLRPQIPSSSATLSTGMGTGNRHG